jgi:prophage tail gpP-like protein
LSITFENETKVTIDGTRFRYWEQISIKKQIDNIHMLELGAPFQDDDPGFKGTFVPFSFKQVSATINDDPVFTGTISPINPDMEAAKFTTAVGAYSLPGVLNECMVPGSELPLEFNGMNLHDIAIQLASYFDISVVTELDPGPVFKKVAMRPDHKILPFLTGLAQQRGQIMTSDAVGNLVFWEAIEGGSPVAMLEQGASPLTKITPTFKVDQYYTEITGLKKIRMRSKASEAFTLQNPLLSLETTGDDVIRSYTFELDDTDGADLEAAVTAKMSRMFANSVVYTALVATWRDKNGVIWEPNTIVRVTAPASMIYKPYDFLIKGVTLNKTSKTETAVLTLVMPGSFSTAEPGRMPWEE